MALSFLDSLDEQQLNTAAMVGEKARAFGVDPKLAVAIAYRESKLRPDAPNGSAGEIGLMQVKPTTGELVGFGKKELLNPESNAEAGVKYLKSILDRYDNDPKLAAVGYNAGPDAEFFNGGKLPKSTEEYVKELNGWGAFEPTPQPKEEAAEKESVTVSEADMADKILSGGLSMAESAAEAAMSPQAIMGAEAGAGMATAKGASDLIKELRAGKPAAAAVAPAEGTAGAKWAQKVTGHVKPGVETVAEAATDYRRAMPQGKVSGRMAKRFGIPAPGEPAALADRLIARAAAEEAAAKAAQAAAQPTTAQAAKSALSKIGQFTLKMPPISGALTGGLAGIGAVSGAEDAASRYHAGDKLGAAIAGTGALGSAISAIPTLPTRVVGGGLAITSPAALAVLDHMRKMSAQKAQGALSNTDALGNPLP